MCGRVRIKATKKELEEAFDVEVEEEFPTRYNLAPTEVMPVILLEGERRVMRTMRWGFVTEKSLLINARSESVAQRPAFSESFRHRRALVPVSAFYEWRRKGKMRQPFSIEMLDGEPFAIAAIWEPAADSDRVCLLTTESNELVASIHDRMPVIVGREDYARWLEPKTPIPEIKNLLLPFPEQRMKMYPVNPAVNKSGHDAPECAEPWTESAPRDGRSGDDPQANLF